MLRKPRLRNALSAVNVLTLACVWLSLTGCRNAPVASNEPKANVEPDKSVKPVEPAEPEARQSIEIGNLRMYSTDDLWGEAKGMLASRMACDVEADATVYRTVWTHPDGDRLVCLQYPGLELFGTPYNVTILDRDLKVLYQMRTGAGQDDTPYCIALIREPKVGDWPRTKWELGVAYWGNHYQEFHDNDPVLGPLRDGKARAYEDEPFEFYGFSVLDRRNSKLLIEDANLEGEIHWIEPGENLLKHAVRDKDDPRTFRLPRAFVEKNLVKWLQSSDSKQIVDALEMMQVGSVRSQDVRERLVPVVASLFNHERVRVRQMAAGGMIALLGHAAAPHLATLVEDTDERVRGFATLALLLIQDADYVDAINTGCEELADFDEASVMIWAIERWGHVGLAAGLIQFLEDDEYLESYSTSWWEMTVVQHNFGGEGTPALQARKVLHQLTRAWFPFDKTKAMAAWRRAGHLPDHERKAMLQTLLKQHAELQIDVKADGKGFHLTVHNPSDHDVWLPKEPTCFQVTDHNHSNVEYRTHQEERQRQAFIKVGAGKSHVKTFPHRDSLLLNETAKEKPVRVRVIYAETGKAFGVNAWQGVYESTLKHDPNPL